MNPNELIYIQVNFHVFFLNVDDIFGSVIIHCVCVSIRACVLTYTYEGGVFVSAHACIHMSAHAKKERVCRGVGKLRKLVIQKCPEDRKRNAIAKKSV